MGRLRDGTMWYVHLAILVVKSVYTLLDHQREKLTRGGDGDGSGMNDVMLVASYVG
jgi:hypothetical protein